VGKDSPLPPSTSCAFSRPFPGAATRDGILFPIEVKCKTVLTGHDLRGLRAFREGCGSPRVAAGIVVYAGTEAVRMDGHTLALPWDVLCR